MKNMYWSPYRAVTSAILLLVLGGCLSAGSSREAKFYTIRRTDKDSVGKKSYQVSNLGIEIGPVKIPEYQNRPQIVTQNKDGMLSFSEFNRWGESLNLSIARLINENLSLILQGADLQMFPSNLSIPIKYQVIIDVLQLDNQLDRDMNMVAQWSIIDVENNKMIFTKRSTFLLPINPHTFTGLSLSMSQACGALSSDIASELVSIETKKAN